MSILLLGGSPSLVSSSGRLLEDIGARLELHGYRCTTLQVRDLPAQALLHADFGDAAILRAKALVEAADAIVIATPVYKASYTGILKAFLDLLAQDGLAGKLVLPLATGGSLSHMLALDYALRPVLATLAARQVLASIYATPDQLQWSEESGLSLDSAIEARVAIGVNDLASTLTILRQHRPAQPPQLLPQPLAQRRAADVRALRAAPSQQQATQQTVQA
jgi:FMN reductase